MKYFHQILSRYILRTLLVVRPMYSTQVLDNTIFSIPEKKV